jgi:GR25 family glycosyltransferase involved in LPS biosynthesis
MLKGTPFYCLAKDFRRKDVMKDRFRCAGIDGVIFHPGIPITDGRIAGRGLTKDMERVWSIMYGHLDMLRWFYYTTDAEIGVFCEDDILIHRDFVRLFPEIQTRFNELSLDVMCLGYLCENPIDTYCNFPWLRDKTEAFLYRVLGYPDSLWGMQMYILRRSYVKYILDVYETVYAEASLKTAELTPFAADWTITKATQKRGLVFPLLVIEDNSCGADNVSQSESHKRCFYYSFDERAYVI